MKMTNNLHYHVPIKANHQLETQQRERERKRGNERTDPEVHEDDDKINDTNATPLPTDKATVALWSYFSDNHHVVVLVVVVCCQLFLVGWV